MTKESIYAWIFLSIFEQPTPLWDVIASADYINHAIPTLRELQTSLGWLQAQGLVKKEEKKYTLTEEGAALRNLFSHKKKIFPVWDEITDRFSKLPEINFIPDDLTKEDVDLANKLYIEMFNEALRKVDGKKSKS